MNTGNESGLSAAAQKAENDVRDEIKSGAQGPSDATAQELNNLTEDEQEKVFEDLLEESLGSGDGADAQDDDDSIGI